jgi:hypothetical protein
MQQKEQAAIDGREDMVLESHEAVQAYCEETIRIWRSRVGIETVWSVEVDVHCPAEMGVHEASIWWDAEVWYARLEVACTFDVPMLEWLVVHELVELRRWRTSSHFFEVHLLLVEGEDRDRLLRQYHLYRNQEVEAEVYQLLGRRRPFHQRIRSDEKKVLAELDGE